MTEMARLIDQAALNSNPENRCWIVRALGEHESSLVRYAMMFVGDVDRARDIVQDTFLKLCWQRHELDETHVKGWLYRVCRNRAIDVCRKESRMKVVEPRDLDVAGHENGPGHKINQQESSEQLDSQISKLPKQQQEALRLKYQGGLSYREIAEVMDTTTNNVGVLLHTAIGKLRLQLGAES